MFRNPLSQELCIRVLSDLAERTRHDASPYLHKQLPVGEEGWGASSCRSNLRIPLFPSVWVTAALGVTQQMHYPRVVSSGTQVPIGDIAQTGKNDPRLERVLVLSRMRATQRDCQKTSLRSTEFSRPLVTLHLSLHFPKYLVPEPSTGTAQLLRGKVHPTFPGLSVLPCNTGQWTGLECIRVWVPLCPDGHPRLRAWMSSKRPVIWPSDGTETSHSSSVPLSRFCLLTCSEDIKQFFPTFN